MTTIIFIVSFVAMIAMVASKIFELKVRKIDILTRVFGKGDNLVSNFVDSFIYTYNRYKKIGQLFFFDFLPGYVYEVLVRAKDWVAKKYYLAGDEFRGRRILRSKGSVSFFLQKITEEKTNSEARKA